MRSTHQMRLGYRQAGALAVSLALLAAVPTAATPEPTAPELWVEVLEKPNRAAPGQVPVALVTTDALDATMIDPASVTLAGMAGGTTPAARLVDDSVLAFTTDVAGDDRDDLVVLFDKEELAAAGALHAGTRRLTVAGRLPDGSTVAGAAPVEVKVVLEIKFDEALEVRLADGRLHSRRGGSLEPVQAVLDRHRAIDISPLIQGVSPAELTDLAATAERRFGRPAPDLASWYHITLPPSANVDQAINEFQALDAVSHVYPLPDPPPPPQVLETPDFTDEQGYFRPAPQGIDADFSRANPDMRGAGIGIVDLEYNWNPFHEDLQLDWDTDIGGDDFPRSTSFGDDHGTAVFGEIVAVENEYGVTGGLPDADSMRGISPVRQTSMFGTCWCPADAMVYAAGQMEPGDIFLIEQQTVGPNGGTNYAPIEWMQSAFDATVLMTQLGIVVVATGGNGGENLDGPEFQGRFDRDVRDSGAVIVGAGHSSTRARLGFSVYGSRLDLQGWGHNITTTGYGGLHGATPGLAPGCPLNLWTICMLDPNKDRRYTATFGGTSGAGPIVVTAVGAMQSYLIATGVGRWSGRRIADFLICTGTPQGGDTSQHIGPLADLAAAMAVIEAGPPVTQADCPRWFAFEGFFGLTDDGLNEVESGTTVPLSFALGGDEGIDVLAEGSPRSTPIDCDTGEQLGPGTPTEAGEPGLSYDEEADRYTYAWATDPVWAGTCRRVSVAFIDESEHAVDFDFEEPAAAP